VPNRNVGSRDRCRRRRGQIGGRCVSAGEHRTNKRDGEDNSDGRLTQDNLLLCDRTVIPIREAVKPKTCARREVRSVSRCPHS
jgi:hypothetical protein